MRNIRKFLQRDAIRNAYQISMLDADGVTVETDDMDDPSGVVLVLEGTVTMKGKKTTLVELLKRLEPGEYRFHSIDSQAFEAAKEVVEDIDDSPTWMFKRGSEKFEEPDVDVVPLPEDAAHEINRYWRLQGGDSTDYIRNRIRNGPAYGIYIDNELVAWSLTHRVTEDAMMLGFLHVKEEWRCRGMAKAVTERLCQEASELGVVPVVDIYQDNVKSLELAKTMGFEKIGEGHWFSGKITREQTES